MAAMSQLCQAFLIKNGTIVDSGQTQRLLKHISQLIKVTGVWTSPTQTRGSKEITITKNS